MLTTSPAGVPLLRDEFAPVDRLVHLGAAARGER
jgi:hypothetical protein